MDDNREVTDDRLEGLKMLLPFSNQPIKLNIPAESMSRYRFTPDMSPKTVTAIMDHGYFIKRLLKLWDAHPHLRFGQLLMNAFGKSQTVGTLQQDIVMITKMYDMSDEELFNNLESFYADREADNGSK